MRKLFTILSLLITTLSYGQIITTSAIVADTTKLKAYNGTSALVLVTDSAYHGFYYRCTGCTVDHSKVFQGVASRKWSRSVQPDVYSATNDLNIWGSLTGDMEDQLDLTDTLQDHRTAIDGKQAADADLTAIGGLAASNDDIIQRKSGAWTNRTIAQLKTDLSLVKGDVGLGNVDNTSDVNKPISTATQTALDLKANLASPTFTGIPAAPTAVAGTNTTQLATTAHVLAERTNTATLTNKTLTSPVINTPTGIVKGDVGLGNVDNTSDVNKPVSTATQAALDGKQATVTDATDLSVNTLTLNDNTSDPSAPAAGAKVYAKEYQGGLQLLGQIDEAGNRIEYAPWSLHGSFGYVQVQTSSAISSMGILGGATALGLTSKAITNTSTVTQVKRVSFVTGTTATDSAGLTGNTLTFWRGNGAGKGGFFFAFKFTPVTTTTGTKGFIGLWGGGGNGGTAQLSNDEPSVMVDIAAFAWDSDMTNIRFMHNDASGVATEVDLGVNYPSNTNNADLYEAWIWCFPNSSEIYYRLRNVTDGVETSGTASSNLPTSSSFLRYDVWINNGATGAAATIDLASIYATVPY